MIYYKTAEQVFKQDSRFHVRSAGLSPKSPHQISQLDIDRADMIFVMEQSHKKQILQQYNILSDRIQVMDIDDVYKYMDEELVELLQGGVDNFLLIKNKTQLSTELYNLGDLHNQMSTAV